MSPTHDLTVKHIPVGDRRTYHRNPRQGNTATVILMELEPAYCLSQMARNTLKTSPYSTPQAAPTTSPVPGPPHQQRAPRD